MVRRKVPVLEYGQQYNWLVEEKKRQYILLFLNKME